MSGGRAAPRGDAVVWDYDGTLVSTEEKNFGVTRAIVERVTSRPAGGFEALASPASYRAALARSRNWREFYARSFGLAEAEIDRAGLLWTEYQLGDATPTPLVAGIPEVLRSLRHLPHGIVSQNASGAIAAVLDGHGLRGCFRSIIGFEEVDIRRQKPEPDGLLKCVEILTAARPGTVFYIGDHETDAVCAARARAVLLARKAGVRIVSIAALYGSDSEPRWSVQPDHAVHRPCDIAEVVMRYAAPPPAPEA